jgi:hypothetical protein
MRQRVKETDIFGHNPAICDTPVYPSPTGLEVVFIRSVIQGWDGRHSLAQYCTCTFSETSTILYSSTLSNFIGTLGIRDVRAKSISSINKLKE